MNIYVCYQVTINVASNHRCNTWRHIKQLIFWHWCIPQKLWKYDAVRIYIWQTETLALKVTFHVLSCHSPNIGCQLRGHHLHTHEQDFEPFIKINICPIFLMRAVVCKVPVTGHFFIQLFFALWRHAAYSFFFCNAIHLITFCFRHHVAIMFLARKKT